MTATKTNKHHLNNAIGIVSDSRVVVHNGKDSSVIKHRRNQENQPHKKKAVRAELVVPAHRLCFWLVAGL